MKRLIGKRRARRIGQLYEAGFGGGGGGGGWRDQLATSYFAGGGGRAYDPNIAEIVGPDPYDGRGVVVDHYGGHPAENFLGFEALALAAGASVDIVQQPQVDFRVDRFKVANSIAPNFTIDELKVGTRTLFATTGAVPAEAFTADSVNALISSFTATVSMQITLSVTNVSGGASDFRALMLGRALV